MRSRISLESVFEKLVLVILFIHILDRYAGRAFKEAGTFDFIVIYNAALRIFSDPLSIYQPTVAMTYKYSPLFALILNPLAQLPLQYASLLWLIVSTIALMVSYLYARKIFSPQLPSWLTTLIFISLLFFVSRPFIYEFKSNQFDLFILFLVLQGLLFVKNKNTIGSSCFLALAFNIKLFPLIIIPYFLLSKRYRVLIYIFCWSFLFFILIPSLVLSFKTNTLLLQEWYKVLSISSPEILIRSQNQSLCGLLMRFFYKGSPYGLQLLHLSFKTVFMTSLGIMGILYASIFWPRQKLNETSFPFDITLLIICTILFPFQMWVQSYVMLLPVFIFFISSLITHWQIVKNSPPLLLIIGLITLFFSMSHSKFYKWLNISEYTLGNHHSYLFSTIPLAALSLFLFIYLLRRKVFLAAV